MKKLIKILLVALLVAGGVFLVRQKKMNIAAAGVQKVRTTVVRTAEALNGDLSITRSFLARVEPWRSAEVGARISSRVTDIPVQEGSVVSKGQVLAILDSEELLAKVGGGEAAVLQSRMQADAAAATVTTLKKNIRFLRRELGRDKLLVREGAIAKVIAETSQDRLDDAKGRLDAMQKTARAAMEQVKVREREQEQARTRLTYTRILAPFDGVVARRMADPGDMAVPGQALLNIEDHGRFKVNFDVPQSELSWIKKNMEVVTASDPSLHILVSRIHPSLNRDRTLTVECDAPATHKLWSGSTLQVKVMLNRFKNKVLLPEESIIPVPGGGDAVFIVKNGVTAAMAVTILGRSAGQVAVSGVESGTRVVQNTYLGWNRLASGEPVEVLP